MVEGNRCLTFRIRRYCYFLVALYIFTLPTAMKKKPATKKPANKLAKKAAKKPATKRVTQWKYSIEYYNTTTKLTKNVTFPGELHVGDRVSVTKSGEQISGTVVSVQKNKVRVLLEPTENKRGQIIL